MYSYFVGFKVIFFSGRTNKLRLKVVFKWCPLPNSTTSPLWYNFVLPGGLLQILEICETKT